MRSDEEGQGPVIRDRRRIDPATGQVRDTGEASAQHGQQAGSQHRPGKQSVSKPRVASGPGPWPTLGFADEQPSDGGIQDAGEAGTEEAAAAAAKLAERTADLQRLQAEYANYRKRVERDRLAVREQALANVLNELVPVLDDIGRAREHGELTGGFKSVGESLEGVAFKLGLTPFGESGDPFDPTLHEALLHSYSADVTEPTAVQILQPGYKVGERIIRPARVAVAEPGGDPSGEAVADSAGVSPAIGDNTGGDDTAHGDDTGDTGGDASAGDGTGER